MNAVVAQPSEFSALTAPLCRGPVPLVAAQVGGQLVRRATFPIRVRPNPAHNGGDDRSGLAKHEDQWPTPPRVRESKLTFPLRRPKGDQSCLALHRGESLVCSPDYSASRLVLVVPGRQVVRRRTVRSDRPSLSVFSSPSAAGAGSVSKRVEFVTLWCCLFTAERKYKCHDAAQTHHEVEEEPCEDPNRF